MKGEGERGIFPKENMDVLKKISSILLALMIAVTVSACSGGATDTDIVSVATSEAMTGAEDSGSGQTESDLTDQDTFVEGEGEGDMGMPPEGGMGDAPGAPPGGAGTTDTSKVSVTEGDWSFDLVTTTSSDETLVTSTITYYAGKTEEVVIVPSVLGGATVTEIAAQAFGHHSEIMAVYVPGTVKTVADWAFYDLNTAELISFANGDVVIDDDAFQSSGNATLYMPEVTGQSSAGGKEVVSSGTEFIAVNIVGSKSAAVAGGIYLNITTSDYGISAEDVAAIAASATYEVNDVSYSDGTLTVSGEAYEAKAQVVEINEAFEDEITEAELSMTFRSLTEEQALSLNASIASDESYSDVKSSLKYEAGYYINGNPVTVDDEATAYDVATAELINRDGTTGLFPSTGEGYYKYVTYRDEDNDGDVDVIYYSPYTVTYSYNNVTILSDNENLNGLSARDILSTEYLTYANAIIEASGEGNVAVKDAISVETSVDGAVIDANSNEERSILWADDYGTITVNHLVADSTAVGDWAKMSFESGLSAYNVEIVMEWGMNALLYATNGGSITVGDLSGEESVFTANGDGANGIIAGGAGTSAGDASAPADTANVSVYNASFTLEGWNNHVADVVYGGYAYLEDVTSTTGIAGSYSVGQASALANDFGNGVVDVIDFDTIVYGNRSAGAYVIGGGVITASNSSFTSMMDAGMVSASGGTFLVDDTFVTGQMAFRNRGGINTDSKSEFDGVSFTAQKDLSGYTYGEKAEAAVNTWEEATGSSALIHYMMSDPSMTIGQLCDNYDVSESSKSQLLSTLSSIAGSDYTEETLLRNSVLDNTYYNYSAGAYTGSTDFSDVPYMTVGSAFGGLVSSVFEFEASGIQLELLDSDFQNNNDEEYQYLVASEAGSAPVITFINSDAEGIIWNEGDVTRSVEGRSSERSSAIAITFNNSDYTGSFADGSNGLWDVANLDYVDGSGNVSSLNGNYYGAEGNWGISVSFETGASWIVTHDSYLGSLTIDETAVIAALSDKNLVMTVDGVETSIEPGTYTGEIIVRVIE